MLRNLEYPGGNLTVLLSSKGKKWSACSEIMKPAHNEKTLLEILILTEIKKCKIDYPFLLKVVSIRRIVRTFS